MLGTGRSHSLKDVGACPEHVQSSEICPLKKTVFSASSLLCKKGREVDTRSCLYLQKGSVGG